jgi:hypothetical protein
MIRYPIKQRSLYFLCHNNHGFEETERKKFKNAKKFENAKIWNIFLSNLKH